MKRYNSNTLNNSLRSTQVTTGKRMENVNNCKKVKHTTENDENEEQNLQDSGILVDDSSSDSSSCSSDCMSLPPLRENDLEQCVEISPSNDTVDNTTASGFFDINLRMFPSYEEDILKNLKISERTFRPDPMYIHRQISLTSQMKPTLINWMSKVALDYNLETDTIFFAVSLLDRYLSVHKVQSQDLQLIGTVVLYIAAKYEEVYPPEINQFLEVTSAFCTKELLVSTEQTILKALNFELYSSNAYEFLNIYNQLVPIPEKVMSLSQYICELSLAETSNVLRYYPSQIAAASIAIANCCLCHVIWTLELEEATAYVLEELLPVLIVLSKVYFKSQNDELKSIKTKYSTSSHHQIACMTPVLFKEAFFIKIIRQYNKFKKSNCLHTINPDDFRENESLPQN